MQEKIEHTKESKGTIEEEKLHSFQSAEKELAPDDWKIVKVGDLVDFSRKPHGLNLTLYKNIPFITMEMIPTEKIYVATYILKKRDQISSGVYCEKGDILLPKITPCFENGKQGIVENIPTDFAFATTEVYPIKPKNDQLDKMFLYYFLLEPVFRKAIADKMQGATGRRRVPRDALSNTSILLPPILEQRRIAKVLGTVQRAIGQQDKIIEAAKNLKKSLIGKFLTEGVEHTELKETEIGLIPANWKVANVRDAAETKSGGTPSRKRGEYYNGNIYWVKSGELEDNIIYATEEKITNEGLQNSSAKIFPRGTLLIAMYGATVGKTGILGVDAATNQAICALFPKNESFLSEFMRYYFILIRPKLLDQRFGGAQPNISQTILENIKVPLPPISEQHEISHVLNTIDKKIEVEMRKKGVLQRLFRTMLHRLMTGEIRLRDVGV